MIIPIAAVKLIIATAVPGMILFAFFVLRTMMEKAYNKIAKRKPSKVTSFQNQPQDINENEVEYIKARMREYRKNDPVRAVTETQKQA